MAIIKCSDLSLEGLFYAEARADQVKKNNKNKTRGGKKVIVCVYWRMSLLEGFSWFKDGGLCANQRHLGKSEANEANSQNCPWSFSPGVSSSSKM